MNLKDIAKLAGVSGATVSNVINGNYQKVSDKTRAKIEKIIREYDYKPNVMARSLVKKESKIISLVVPYVGGSEDFLVNPYNAHIIAALENYVRNKDYYLMLRCVGATAEVIPLLSSWNVDGAFFLGVMPNEVRQIQDALNAPVVFIDTYSEKEKFMNVGLDDYRGGFLSARYLIGCGHKRIALATPGYEGEGVIRERFKGFTDALSEAGIEFDEKRDVFRTDTLYASAVKVGQDIAFSDKGYTAVATMSDIVAFGLIEGMRQCGIRVPEDISVIGFDNLPESEYFTPKLTTIAQDFSEKARVAGDMMFDLIEGKSEIQNVHLNVKVVERQSVWILK